MLLLTLISSAHAEQRELSGQQSGLDVVLVLDASGSMLKTDPKNLRYEGTKLLLSFLGDGDRISLISFAESAKVVRDLSPVSRSTSGQILSQAEHIQPLGPYSDISEGIKLAKAVLDASPRPGAQRVIILLSDGRMEPDPAVSPAFARTLELVHDVLPELKTKETKVFTLAFSDQADRAFLGEVSAATDGLTWFTATAEDIHKSFADLFLAIKRPQVVAQTNRGFKIDDDVEEATFYINREPDAVLSLTSPKGEQMAAGKTPEWVGWYRGQNFDVITVKEPDPGNWLVAGTASQDGFATVLTDLKLLTDWPLVVRAGDEPLIQARLYEDNKPVSLPEMSGVVQYGFQISPTDRISEPLLQEPLLDDGKKGDKVSQDGIFSALTRLDQAGEYRLTVVAKGPTFQRSQQIPFTVRPRLVSLEIKGKEEHKEQGDEHHDEKGAEGQDVPDHQAQPEPVVSIDEDAEIIARIGKEAISFRSFEVNLIAIDADRRRLKIPLKRGGVSSLEFSTMADKLEEQGDFSVKAQLRGETKKGEEVEAESLPMNISFRFRRAKGRATATPLPRHDDTREEGKKAENQIPVIPLAVVTISTLAIAAFLIVLTKRSKDQKATRQKYVPQKQLIDALASLEERVSTNSVELTNPIFEMLENERETTPEGGVENSRAEQSAQVPESAKTESPKEV
jgi:hypothetical protein